jgi:LuxR family maltose regulon positive regulatory protein
LADPAGPPVALITAPAGYGRTTLLAEWARRDPRGVAWIALERAHDEDPSLLAAAIARALDAPEPFALALDDVHLLRSRGACNLLRVLVDRVPPGSRVVLSSRVEPPLPIGRMRAQRSLVEIGAGDLAMTPAETAQLFGAEGLRLPLSEVEHLVRRTEGWPAAVYLAALCLRDENDPSAAARFRGDDRAVRRFLADSVLSELPEGAARFLAHTSVVDRLSGSLCDAMLGIEGAGRLLEELATRRRLLVPLDRSGEWYRCPLLLRQMLVSELRRTDPAGERALRRRALDWYAAHDDSEGAIDQAIAAADLDRAGELLWQHAPGYVAAGRRDVVARWLAGFTDDQVGADPRVSVVRAWSAFARGDLGAVQRWAAVAQRRLGDGAARDEVGAATVTLRSGFARDGLAAAARAAGSAREWLPDDSPWLAICCFLEGSALHLTGDTERGELVLEDGARHGAVVAPAPHTLCLAQLALMAAERDDWEGGAALAARARAQVDHYGLHEYPISALVFAASAAIRARRGRVDEAQEDVRQALRLLDGLVDFAPWYLAEVRVALARALLRLSDVATARVLIDGARRDARGARDPRLLAEWVSDLEASADAAAAAAPAAPASLTTAELRILRFLPTHLSFREIASRLYVSANTVKTQAHAVYRKLDASSRSQAVARASELGLLDL